MNKYKSNSVEEPKKELMSNSIDKYTFTPQDFSYENKHYKYIKYTKHENKPLKARFPFFSLVVGPTKQI